MNVDSETQYTSCETAYGRTDLFDSVNAYDVDKIGVQAPLLSMSLVAAMVFANAVVTLRASLLVAGLLMTP